MSSDKWKTLGAAIILVFVALQLIDFLSISSLPSETVTPQNRSTTTTVTSASTTSALVPGELPGYTGWARPETTLAKFFSITSISPTEPRLGEPFTIHLWCHQNEICSKASSLFFLRAYGPSVIPGIVRTSNRGKYAVEFTFPDPGQYTVEVVLTFSNPPPLEQFPLQSGQEEPPYEGYLLPGFPLTVMIQQAESPNTVLIHGGGPQCQPQDIAETSPLSSYNKARWKVMTKANAPGYIPKSTGISKNGYLRNVNSIGIQMDYEYISKCHLVPSDILFTRQTVQNPFQQCGKNIHILFIGDSVMRVQKQRFDEMVEHLPNVQTTYVTLYGGYLRVKRMTDTFSVQMDDFIRRAADDSKIILFNTGLHDIHRLCGNEWKDDRYDYLDKELLDSGTFSCTQQYRTLLREFALIVQSIPADLRIFQSTTAAWPKYGNFGIEWPLGGQNMPVATDSVPIFNAIAFDVLQEFAKSIQIVDGYWITYSRPDNREVGTIGSKLSHPGLEVQIAMCRIWITLILDTICSGK